MDKKKKQSTAVKDKKNKNLIFIVLVAVLISFAVYSAINNNQNKQTASEDIPNQTTTEEKSAAIEEPKDETAETAEDIPTGVDLKILKSEIDKKAKFYPYEADGVYMEVIALEANDGSIRTALNTCQICYNSGQGYYKQEGNKLVCQNCGNRFGVDDVEIVRGGCNPVPVVQEFKTDDGEYITINKDFLEESKELFIGWKR